MNKPGPTEPDPADWQRRWAIDAGNVVLQPVTRSDPGIRRLTAITGAQNTASRRLLERQGFRVTGTLPGTDEVSYARSVS